MKYIGLLLIIAYSPISNAGSFSDWLINNNKNGYFPVDGSYEAYKNVCNKSVCFNLVFVSYVTPSNKGIRRLAVFSDSAKYLGVYSGFNERPVAVKGSKLLFPYSNNEFGISIDFNSEFPPKTVYLDGEHFTFESEL